MQKMKEYIKQHWLMLLIIILPLLDIITYFLMDTKLGSILTWTRFLLLPIIFISAFWKSKNKKKYYIFVCVLLLYALFHIYSCYQAGYQSIFEDLSNMLRILYMPILLFSFVDLYHEKSEQDIVNGFKIALGLIILSLIIAIISGTAVYTYGDNLRLGVIGWFFNKNTQSLILIVLSFVIGIYNMPKKSFYITLPIIFLVLYFNGTKTCYITLVALCLMICFYMVMELKNKKKFIYTLIFLGLALGLFKISPTYLNLSKYITEQTNRNDKINNSIKPGGTDPSNVDLKFYEETYREYALGPIIDRFGIRPVIIKYDYSIDSFILSNTRTQKKIVASLIYDQENFLSHAFGFEFTKINNFPDNDKTVTYDLENDITALYYYCGFVGFILYFGFVLYYLIAILKILIFNLEYILKPKYMVWLVLIMLLIFGAEYNGALLRRPNGNIFFALVLSFAYYKFKEITKKNKKNKVSFLLLHLGYGGIETATINTANALSKFTTVELISFYNLPNNQEKLINKNIKITYLSKDNPNREEFKQACQDKKIIQILKEGLKSCKILFLKKYLIMKWIYNSDSKVIISTRYDFSKILSKYKPKDSIAIAAEHHHHNNNSKYIKVLTKKYQNIDYLVALTNGLKDDYSKFLKNNKHTKIVVIPNMIAKSSTRSDLKNKTLISVGRLHKGKKILELIDIVSKINDIDTFYIIGDGEDYKEAEEKINSLKLTDKIKLLGYQNKDTIGKYLDKSSIFVMASISEGLPMVLIEAMSHGVPCIAYETESGVNDIIKNGENGYIIKNRDEQAFIASIKELINDIKKLKMFSKNAIETSNEYSEEIIIKKWKEILKSIL